MEENKNQTPEENKEAPKQEPCGDCRYKEACLKKYGAEKMFKCSAYKGPKPAPKPKYKSRATRLSEVVGELEDIKSELEEAKTELEDNEDEREKFGTANPNNNSDKGALDKANEALQKINASEAESLAGEIENWRDNMSGTPLESTEKFQEVSDCADAIREAADNISNITTEVSDKSDIENVISEIDDAIGQCESVEFPGAFGR